MNLITEIIRNAEADLSRQLGIEVKLMVSDIKLLIQPAENEIYKKYVQLWKVCDKVVQKEIIANPEKEESLIHESKKVYVYLATHLVKGIHITKMMRVIGKERSTYYNTIRTATNMYSSNDKKFMNLFKKTKQQLKLSGYENIEI
ncbi:MAG TPA: hypothetical protein PK431_01515 [Chitinophagales bacterium]|nr:hypothetical protein [Chitinophagales bacterium]